MIETNCTGLVTVTHAILPGMVERNRGHVFNMRSVAGTHPYIGRRQCLRHDQGGSCASSA